MVFSDEITFREYLKTSIDGEPLATSDGRQYFRLPGPLSHLGMKVDNGKQSLLSSVSSIAITSDRFPGLEIGQEAGHATGPFGDYFKLCQHIPDSVNLHGLSQPASTDASPDLYALTLRNIRRVAALPDESLKEWLQVVPRLDQQGVGIDTDGLNIMYQENTTGVALKWVDLDDHNVAFTTPEQRRDHNHLEAIMGTLRESIILVPLNQPTKLCRLV